MAFEAKHIVRTHTVQLDARPDEVFPLFEPIGEKKWVEGWEPVMHYPRSGAAIEGAVFTTRQEGEAETIWALAEYEREEWRVKYLRVTPRSRVAVVEVRCEDAPGGTTRAHVTYTFTALSEEGNRYLAEFTEPHYREYINSWETDINRYLRGHRAGDRAS
jgi:hypothetical protein